MAALPGAVPAVLLLDELRRLRERQTEAEESSTPPSCAHFVVDANGTVSHTQVATIVIAQSMQATAMGKMASTVISASEVAVSAADTTAQAASKAAGAAFDAATRAAVSARVAVSTLGRQIANADRIAELRSQATELAAFQGSKDWLDLMRALFAVGIAIAAADGEISEHERHAIKEFVGGAGYSKLPTGLKADIDSWLAKPPSINQAFALASICDEEGMHHIENVMEVVTNSDDLIHPAELEFREKWRAMREAPTA